MRNDPPGSNVLRRSSCIPATSLLAFLVTSIVFLPAARAAVVTNGTGLLGEYHNNMDFTAFAFSRTDPTIDFDWGTGSPDPRVGADTFSVRWSGFVKPRFSQTYTFYTTTDDGVRLWVDGQLIIDRWIDQPPTTWTGTIALNADQLYDIRMDFYENGIGAVARMEWQSASQPREVTPQTRLFPPTPGVNRRPNTPLITEPGTDGQLVNPADVHMETSAFSDPDPGDQHVCSDFEIWTITPSQRVWITSCIGGIEKVHTHLGDGVFEGSHAGRTELFYETDYRLRVRHRDDSGDAATEWSAWAERLFRTTSQIDPIPGAPGWLVNEPNYKVEIVATGFQLPVNIAFVPNPGPNTNSPFYYVTELYGTIKVVTRDGTVRDYATNLLNFNPTGAFPGSGEQGLTGIVVDPATGNVFASLLYDAGGSHYPKVVRFTSTNGGLSAATMTTILDMPGETQGQSHQISNLSIGPDAKLYVHMGDGFDASTGQDTNSFRGKILRLNLDGRPPTDNPFYRAIGGTNAQDYIFAYGLRNPFGGDWRASDGMHYEVENGPSVDRFARVVRARNYLYDGSDASMANFAIYNWAPSTAPVNIAFVQTNRFGGSGFPADKFDHAFVSESGPTWASGPQGNGKRITEFVLDSNGNLISGPTPLVEYNGTGKATVVALAAGPDGLYFSDLYKDLNYTSPIDRGANILRVRWINTNAPPTVALTNPINGATFRAGTNILLGATATATGTNISVVEFFANATKLGQDATNPYSLTWSNVSAGLYQLTARATDARGRMATSAVVVITVRPLLHAQSMSGGRFRLWFDALPPTSYVIEASANLSTWSPVSTNSAVGGQVEYIEVIPATGKRFFRVRQTP
jgi:glucose/arabinose dehydrogenase